MSDDSKTPKVDPPDGLGDYIPTNRRGRGLIVLAVLVVVMGIAGIAGWKWHEQPSFCNAICHRPMDPFLATFLDESGKPGTDKMGNVVSDGSSMLAVTHREAGVDCLGCHVPTIGEMVSEGIHWITGNYYNPLAERDLSELTKARKLKPDQFFLNKSCHHLDADGQVILSRDQLVSLTADLKYNPHSDYHEVNDCGDCHKAHRASVYACTGCHKTIQLPAGWLSIELEETIKKPWNR